MGRVFCMHTKTRARISTKKLIFFLLVIGLAVLVILRFTASRSGDDLSADDPDQNINGAPANGDAADIYVRDESGEIDALGTVNKYAADKGISMTEYPDTLMELLEKNPEALDFVMYYPEKKDLTPTVDLSNYANCSDIPLLIQWDDRWGYTNYSGELFGMSGCGPTCLSMVCIYLLQDTKYTPRYIADFSEENGYYYTGSGSTWTLISEGAEKLGLNVKELPLSEGVVIDNLQKGNPVICVVGPGVFTTTGHFIVLTGYENGKIKVNDPNSPKRSEMLWDFSQFSDQIRDLWALSR